MNQMNMYDEHEAIMEDLNRNKMTKENVLKHIEAMGKEVSMKSLTNYWSVEDHYKAKEFKNLLPIMREGYRTIKDGEIVRGLKLIENYITGINGNKIRLLIKANTTGFTESEWWTVENGDLKYDPKR